MYATKNTAKCAAESALAVRAKSQPSVVRTSPGAIANPTSTPKGLICAQKRGFLRRKPTHKPNTPEGSIEFNPRNGESKTDTRTTNNSPSAYCHQGSLSTGASHPLRCRSSVPSWAPCIAERDSALSEVSSTV